MEMEGGKPKAEGLVLQVVLFCTQDLLGLHSGYLIGGLSLRHMDLAFTLNIAHFFLI